MSEVRGIKYKDIKGNVLTIQRSRLTVNGVSVERDANKTYESTRKIEIPKYLKDKSGKATQMNMSSKCLLCRFTRG